MQIERHPPCSFANQLNHTILWHFMSRRAALFTLLVLAFVLIAVTGCSADPKSDALSGSTNAAILIEPGVSVGKVRKGMTTQEVVEELGNPNSQMSIICFIGGSGLW